MTWILTRAEPTEEQWRKLWPSYHPWRENAPTPEERPNNFLHMKAEWGHIYRAMLQAAAEPNAEELDGLCIESARSRFLAIGADHDTLPDHWLKEPDGSWECDAPLHRRRRDEDRSAMQIFLKALRGTA